LDLSYEALLELGDRIGSAVPAGLDDKIISELPEKQFSKKMSHEDERR
jgi:hypothetical protein